MELKAKGEKRPNRIRHKPKTQMKQLTNLLGINNQLEMSKLLALYSTIISLKCTNVHGGIQLPWTVIEFSWMDERNASLGHLSQGLARSILNVETSQI